MASANCKVAASLFKRTLCLSPAQKPSGQRSLLTVSRLQERGLREGRTVHKCFSPHNVPLCRFHAVSLPRQDNMSPSLRTCYKYLNETSRSFAAVIQALDGELRHAVCIFYLVLRALDTVEDDMTIGLETKIPMLHNFHTFLYEADWRFEDSKEKDRQVLEDFPTISLEFRNLAVVYQEVIADICQKMGVGMAEFLEKHVESLLEWDKYHTAASMASDLGDTLAVLETEKFISMVKEHTCLYDIKDPSYSLRTVRRRAWDKIASQIYPNWTEMENKDKKVKQIKDKWKSFRDAYARYMRLVTSNRSGSAACHIKEYIHAKELEFLRPSLSLARTENSWEEAAPTAPVGMDNSSRNSCDQTLDGLEPESQLASSSQSTPATPLGELQTTPRPVPRVAARGTKRKAPESDPNVTMMLQIMSEMKDKMGTNTNTPSYGNKSAQCLAELMDRVPKSLQADMLAGTIRYINTFIPPEEPYLSPEPPPPYGPYANQHPQHLSAPTLRHFTAPPFHSHLPQHAPPYPTQTPTLSTHPQLPTPPSAYTSSTLPDPTYLQTHTSTLSPYRRPQTTPSAYHPTTSQTFHLPTQPPTYPFRTTYPSDYTHLPTLPPYNPQPTPTPPPPPPPQPPATPPSRWPHGTTSRSDWSSFGKAIDAGMSVDDPGESPSFQKL